MKRSVERQLLVAVIFMGLFLCAAVIVHAQAAKAAAAPKGIPVDKLFKYAEALFDAQKYEYAFEEYSKILNLYPDNEYKDDAQYKLAECLSRSSSQWYAIEEWQKLISNYPGSKLVDAAKENIKYATNYLQTSSLPTTTVDDEVAYRLIHIATWFRWNCVWESNGAIVVDKELKQVAMTLFDRIAAEYPKSEAAVYAQYVKAILYTELRSKKDYLSAIEEFQKIADKYPDDYYANESLKQIGDIYENNLKDRKSSLAAYQKLIDKLKADTGNYYVSYCQAKIAYYK